MASFSIVSVTTDTLTISITGLTTGDTVRVFVRLADDASDTTEDVFYTAVGSTMIKQITGLEPGTDYMVNVNVNATGWIGAEAFATQSENVSQRPDDWEWYSTIKSGAEINITAEEWNDFCTTINEFRVYAGLETVMFTFVDPGDPIKASYMRKARTAIGDIAGHGTLPTAVYSGDPITASFFTKLASALNSVD